MIAQVEAAVIMLDVITLVLLLAFDAYIDV